MKKNKQLNEYVMNGIVVINKETGLTSRDVVNQLNKQLNTKKIGHTGTLDPLATGVLVICIGKYTKLVDKITCYDKEYIATIKLGVRTDTLDSTGKIVEINDKVMVDNQVLKNTLNSFLGKSIQEVPKYAAIKINGKKLYEYARNNEKVELPKREIEISDIELLEKKKDEIKFRVVVSKGTYIRSLIRDICEKLNVIGTMSNLKRTRQGMFTIENSYSLTDVKKGNFSVLKVEDIFPYTHYILNDEEYKKVKNGVPILLNKEDGYLFMEYKNQIIAIYKNFEEVYKPYFML